MKAILIIDMPENCYECSCCDGIGCDGIECKNQYKGYVDGWNSGRPSWCPLKPVPDREKANDGSNVEFKMIDEAWTSGFNACLNEIIGGEEE